jgi:hypothetical protein
MVPPDTGPRSRERSLAHGYVDVELDLTDLADT